MSHLSRLRTRIQTSPLGPGLAVALWLVFAVVVWNVVFDRVLVLAGRRYVYEATLAARQDTFLRIDDYMKPAISRGVRVATATGSGIAALGVIATIVAVKTRKPRT
jgi:hypothetical protein